MLEIIERIEQKGRERERLLSQLRLWAEVLAMGIPVADVAGFGFAPDLMTDDERRAARKAHPFAPASNPYQWPEVASGGGRAIRPARVNYVRLTSGERRRLGREWPAA